MHKCAFFLLHVSMCRYCCETGRYGAEVLASYTLQEQSRAKLSPPGLASLAFSVDSGGSLSRFQVWE